MNFKDKKVLVFGLGLLGGGVATTNWLLKQGAKVTVTDPLGSDRLAASIAQIEGEVEFRLGDTQSDADYQNADIVIVNPAFPPSNPWVQLARKLGKPITNEAIIFYDLFRGRVVGVTGTRGKTTTTHWTNHFLKSVFQSTMAGNSSENPFLKILDEQDKYAIAVAETPSYHLEFFGPEVRAADIAVVTNIYKDHINFHGSVGGYADAKMNIFKWQKPDQQVILNYDNEWTDKILSNPPSANVWLFSAAEKLPELQSGLFAYQDKAWFQESKKLSDVLSLADFAKEHGQHNLENLLASALTAHLAGVPWKNIQASIASLPKVPFRQEIIFESDKLKVINDTTATSPDGTIQALKRFGSPHTILITGGTDRDLDFADLARELPEYIRPDNLVLLAGSATDKIRAALGDWGDNVPVHDTLEECTRVAFEKARSYDRSVILFSPASKSFEKFKNEFDRGNQFNELVKQWIKS